MMSYVYIPLLAASGAGDREVGCIRTLPPLLPLPPSLPPTTASWGHSDLKKLTTGSRSLELYLMELAK